LFFQRTPTRRRESDDGRVTIIQSIKIDIMKSIKLTLMAVGIATASLFAFKAIDGGTVKGTVSPAEGAVRAWALSGADTLRAPIVNGSIRNSECKAWKLQSNH
jgi:hypothetical protein